MWSSVDMAIRTPSRSSAPPRRRRNAHPQDRALDLLALLGTLIIVAVVYVYAGEKALLAVTAAAVPLYTLWLRNR